jgi:hypothetical protein
VKDVSGSGDLLVDLRGVPLWSVVVHVQVRSVGVRIISRFYPIFFFTFDIYFTPTSIYNIVHFRFNIGAPRSRRVESHQLRVGGRDGLRQRHRSWRVLGRWVAAHWERRRWKTRKQFQLLLVPILLHLLLHHILSGSKALPLRRVPDRWELQRKFPRRGRLLAVRLVDMS